MPKTVRMRLERLELDDRAQPREAIDGDRVDQYAEAMREGDTFPPIVAFGTEEHAWLSDGWHRYDAAEANGAPDIEVELHEGGLEDAIWYAAGANAQHGLDRTNEDKRRAVELALSVRPSATDREIARQCRVSHPFVARIRSALEGEGSIEQVTHREDPRGRQYPSDRRVPPRRRDPERMNSPVTVTRETPTSPSPTAPPSLGNLHMCHGCNTLVGPDHVCQKGPRVAEPAAAYQRRPPVQPTPITPTEPIDAEFIETGHVDQADAGTDYALRTASLPGLPAEVTPVRAYEVLSRMAFFAHRFEATGLEAAIVAAEAEHPTAALVVHREFLGWYRAFVEALEARSARQLSAPGNETGSQTETRAENGNGGRGHQNEASA